MRVLFLGMWGEFSRIPLSALLAADFEVCGVVVPAAGGPNAPDPPLERLESPEREPGPASAAAGPSDAADIKQLAWANEIPLFRMNQAAHPDTLGALRELGFDVGCVACFSQILPAALLDLPRLGFLNLHPSLLPDYRGPEPLFWTLRQGQQQTGVTIHLMDERLDHGDILQQSAVALADGISGREAERLCAMAGSKLLVDTMRRLQAGSIRGRPQPAGGCYFPAPNNEDFRIPLTWSARRAFNFMRGTAEWQRPYLVEGLEPTILLARAVSYHAQGELGETILRFGRQVWLQFNPGILQATTLF